MISISSSILHRIKLIINTSYKSWANFLQYKISRDSAHNHRKKIILKNGNRIVDRKLKKRIKEYCREYFGSASYWLWLAVYAELRGEFIPGWLPNDYYRFNLLPDVNPQKFMKMSEAKTIDHKLFPGKSLDPLFIRLNGKFYDKSCNFKKTSEIKQLMRDLHCEVIIQPHDGRGGKEIKFLHSNDFNQNNLLLNTDIIVQKVVEQHSELNSLNPSSINTFRALTSINQEGSVVVKFVILRFGRDGARVDNSSSGGGWMIVQLNGIPGEFAYDIIGKKLGKFHPDTGKVYSELSFPFFEDVINFCKNLHKSFPYTGIIGWDVCIDKSAEPMLIEWNANNPSFWPVEANYGPFFKEEVSQRLI